MYYHASIVAYVKTRVMLVHMYVVSLSKENTDILIFAFFHT